MLNQIKSILSHFKTVFGLHKNNNTLVPSLFLYINVEWILWDTSWPALTLVLDQECMSIMIAFDLRNEYGDRHVTLKINITTAFDLGYQHYDCLCLWSWALRLLLTLGMTIKIIAFDLGHGHHDCLLTLDIRITTAYDFGKQSCNSLPLTMDTRVLTAIFLDSVLCPMTKECPWNG